MMHKVFPDKEKAKSIFNMALHRQKSISLINKNLVNIITENYYEVVREISSALFLIEGIKFIGENAHKELIDNLRKHKIFSDQDITFLQDLRIKHNNSLYDGEKINSSYLENNKDLLEHIIDKLKKLVDDKLR